MDRAGGWPGNLQSRTMGLAGCLDRSIDWSRALKIIYMNINP